MKLIALTQGYYAKVSDKDFARVNRFKWCAQLCRRKDGSLRTVYGQSRIKGILVSLHRFILGLTDPKIQVDHRDHDGLNNVRRNLRRCGQKQNIRNIYKRPDTASKYKGVTWENYRQRWKAQIMVSGRNLFIGRFLPTSVGEKAAARAYDAAARKYFGRFASTNFASA